MSQLSANLDNSESSPRLALKSPDRFRANKHIEVTGSEVEYAPHAAHVLGAVV
jgi:hypothetical protein